ncbi:hypothetical protein RGUI_3587 [Rhodovulum sp. P5]|nr:hypothetical protein RGUI_3587 [Rhodovulum sp. P5]
MRNRLGGPLKDALAANLDKDIVRLAAADLPHHFKDKILF